MADHLHSGSLGLTERFIDQGDGTHARQVAPTGQTELADGVRINQIGTTQLKWDEPFNGVSLDLTRWDLARDTGGMVQTVSGGQISIAMGTTAAAELLLVAKKTCTIPANLLAVLNLSQKLAANEIRIGLLECDPESETLAPIPHTITPTDFQNRANVYWGGTTTSTINGAETVSENGPVKAVSTSSGQSVLTASDILLAVRPEDILVSMSTADVSTVKNANSPRISSQLPKPNRVYRPFIWLKNGVAPATSTNLVIQRLLLMDIQELQAQVTGGGMAGGTEAAMAQVLNTASIQGPNAADAAGAMNPVLGGSVARTSAQAAVSATGDTVVHHADLSGRQVVKLLGVPPAHQNGRALLIATTETTLFTGLASNKLDVQSISFVNRDDVAHTVDIRDATGGTVRESVVLSPAGSAGSSQQLVFPAGRPNAAAAANWTAQLREAATTAVEVNLSGYLTTA